LLGFIELIELLKLLSHKKGMAHNTEGIRKKQGCLSSFDQFESLGLIELPGVIESLEEHYKLKQPKQLP